MDAILKCKSFLNSLTYWIFSIPCEFGLFNLQILAWMLLCELTVVSILALVWPTNDLGIDHFLKLIGI